MPKQSWCTLERERERGENRGRNELNVVNCRISYCWIRERISVDVWFKISQLWLLHTLEYFFLFFAQIAINHGKMLEKKRSGNQLRGNVKEKSLPMGEIKSICHPPWNTWQLNGMDEKWEIRAKKKRLCFLYRMSMLAKKEK